MCLSKMGEGIRIESVMRRDTLLWFNGVIHRGTMIWNYDDENVVSFWDHPHTDVELICRDGEWFIIGESMRPTNEPPIFLINGHPCYPVIMKFIPVTEDNDMPHGIDSDDFDPSMFEFPLPTGDEGSRFKRPPKLDNGNMSGAAYSVNNNSVPERPTPAFLTPQKIIRGPETLAEEVIRFHNALLAGLTTYYSPGNQRELMISVLTQDFLHSLLHQ